MTDDDWDEDDYLHGGDCPYCAGIDVDDEEAVDEFYRNLYGE